MRNNRNKLPFGLSAADIKKLKQPIGLSLVQRLQLPKKDK
jgi:hypothetical protein